MIGLLIQGCSFMNTRRIQQDLCFPTSRSVTDNITEIMYFQEVHDTSEVTIPLKSLQDDRKCGWKDYRHCLSFLAHLLSPLKRGTITSLGAILGPLISSDRIQFLNSFSKIEIVEQCFLITGM